MLDAFRFTSNNTRLQKKPQDITINFEINENIKKDVEIKLNPQTNGDNLLVYHGLTLDNNDEHDCLSLSLTFNERKDDRLVHERSKFFGKFFLYDSNHFDLIEECIKIDKPFDRRVLFYYYVLMMDPFDLEKEDPKRKDLHEDKLIINFVLENLQAMEKLSTPLSEITASLEKETHPLIRNFITYKIQQRKLLLKLIDKYQDQYNFLLKDEAL